MSVSTIRGHPQLVLGQCMTRKCLKCDINREAENETSVVQGMPFIDDREGKSVGWILKISALAVNLLIQQTQP